MKAREFIAIATRASEVAPGDNSTVGEKRLWIRIGQRLRKLYVSVPDDPDTARIEFNRIWFGGEEATPPDDDRDLF